MKKTTKTTGYGVTANGIKRGDTVYGVRAGTFLVTGVRLIGPMGQPQQEIVDVREVGPNGQLGRECGMTPECFQLTPR